MRIEFACYKFPIPQNEIASCLRLNTTSTITRLFMSAFGRLFNGVIFFLIPNVHKNMSCLRRRRRAWSTHEPRKTEPGVLGNFTRRYAFQRNFRNPGIGLEQILRTKLARADKGACAYGAHCLFLMLLFSGKRPGRPVVVFFNAHCKKKKKTYLPLI